MSTQQMNLLDLPAEMLLHIAGFIPKSDQTALALTCRGAWYFFKEQRTKLSRSEKKRLLLSLQKKYPGSIICQIDLIIRPKDRCCNTPDYPRDYCSLQLLRRRFYDRNYGPFRSCLPVPSMRNPYFILGYAHVNKVMLRHRLGPKFGMPLKKLSFAAETTPFMDAAKTTFDVKLPFRIIEDKLYMHRKYTIEGERLVHLLAIGNFPIDVCPHIHLEHNSRSRDARFGVARKPIRMPGTAGCQEGNSCTCTSIGTFDPVWARYLPTGSSRSRYKSNMRTCLFCPTDLELRFDNAVGTQTFVVEFWRCVGDGLYMEDDTNWRLGSLNQYNVDGAAYPSSTKIGESAKKYKLGSPAGGEEDADEGIMMLCQRLFDSL